MISQVAGFQIQMIPSKWYIDNQKDKDIVAETCYFVNTEAAQNFSGVIFTSNPSTVPTTITNALRCVAKKKVKYGEVWDLQLMKRSEVQVDDNKENELQQVENPLVSWRKRRSGIKQFKSSTKKKSRAINRFGTLNRLIMICSQGD
ncbi:hypothetical protein C1646_772198 [Rhizophagus diaphanus]|nr:hypothetical protein C1646_772198 [Rhizophagus diaphanus] [Rhizophagus sp. MUCL 43196]